MRAGHSLGRLGIRAGHSLGRLGMRAGHELGRLGNARAGMRDFTKGARVDSNIPGNVLPHADACVCACVLGSSWLVDK